MLHEIIFLVEDVVSDTGEVGVLQVGVEVDLNNTISNGIQVLLLRRSRSTVEDKENRLVLLRSNGILDILLVLAEKFGVELDIAGLVNTMHVTESGSNGEVWRNWGESLVDGKDVLRLGVEGVVVDILVVDTILLTASNTDFLNDLSVFLKLTIFKNLPSQAIASLGQRASGTLQWSEC